MRKEGLFERISDLLWDIRMDIKDYFYLFFHDSIVRWASFSFLLSLLAVILTFIKYIG